MRIGIVSDLPASLDAQRRALAHLPQYQLAWTVRDGVEAVERCARDTPDLVLMDLATPRMDGVEATRRIMMHSPCAILIVTADVDANAARVFAAMGHGAIDAVEAPMAGLIDLRPGVQPLLSKIDAIGRLMDDKRASRPAASAGSASELVVIGASAGGPTALGTMLKGLPKDFPGAIVIVQHVDARFAPGLAAWLRDHSALPVGIAAQGDRPAPGQVLIAGGGDHHLIFRSRDRLGYTTMPSDHAYRPSVDIFMHSAASHWRGRIVGVLLTGMGSDGALGLKGLRALGHHTIVQDRETSAVYGMPKAAAAISAATEILPLGRIAPRLTELMARTRSKRF